MTKRKVGIILMLLAGLTLPVSLFVDSWRSYERTDKSMWGNSTSKLTLGLRGGALKACNKKRDCATDHFKFSMSMFKTTSAKAYFVLTQVTFYGGLLTTLLLLVGAGMLWTNRYHGHTFMNVSLAGVLVVLFAAYFSVMDPGIEKAWRMHRAGFLGFGFSYVMFTVSCTLALFGVRNVWRGTLAEEESEWFGDDGDDVPAN